MKTDVLVIGGGSAGLSAAVALGRSRRSVLVIDSGEPRNAPADGVHNFLTRDGTPPRQLAALGRAEAEAYGVRFMNGTVGDIRRSGNGFEAALGQETVRARRIIVASGVVDVLPEIEGLRERWGRDVLHCPYCHGWEVRDRRIGVLATGPSVAHQAQMFRQLSASVTVFANGFEFPADELEGLEARGIGVVPPAAHAVEVRDDALTGIRLADGSVHALDALVVASRVEPRVHFAAGIGLEAIEHPSGAGRYVPVELGGATAVPGVWAAGNVSDPMAQVIVAAGQGLLAGARVNADLIAEEVAAAVATSRER